MHTPPHWVPGGTPTLIYLLTVQIFTVQLDYFRCTPAYTINILFQLRGLQSLPDNHATSTNLLRGRGAFLLLFTLHPRENTRVERRDLRTFGCLEREQQKSGVTTTEEVRASVLAVWKALEPSKFEKNVDRMRRGATKVVELNGENLYSEQVY